MQVRNYQIVKEVDRNFIIVSKNINKKLKEKYEKQYHNVKFINDDSFHDRFIILDRYVLFLCGSSFKDLGKKCFGISELKDKIGLKVMLEKIGLKQLLIVYIYDIVYNVRVINSNYSCINKHQKKKLQY